MASTSRKGSILFYLANHEKNCVNYSLSVVLSVARADFTQGVVVKTRAPKLIAFFFPLQNKEHTQSMVAPFLFLRGVS